MLDNPTDRILCQLGTLPSSVRPAIIHHGPRRPKGPFAISSENGNTPLLTNDEEAISSKLLVVGRSIGNANRVGHWCVRQTEKLRVKIKSILHDVLGHTCPSRPMV